MTPRADLSERPLLVRVRQSGLNQTKFAVTSHMVQIQQYPVIDGYRKWSVFPESAQRLLGLLGEGLYKSPSLSSELVTFRAALEKLSPYAYRRTASDIRDFASLYYYRGWYRPLPWWNIVARTLRKRAEATRRRNFERKLKSDKDLPFLLLFDGNGYNRESALSRITGPLKSPTEVIAVADLANNWVEPVRKAALQAIDRCFTKTDPSVLAASFSFLAENRAYWKRWNASASQHVMSFFYKSDVIDLLAERLMSGSEARGVRTLSHVIQTDNFDRHLGRVFETSKDAAIRAHALRTLLDGKAVWKTGYTWQWTDKSLGQRKKVPALESRKLSIEVSREPLLEAGLSDKAGQVRKVAAQALIDFGHELNFPITDIAKRLTLDISPGVRRRGEYLSRKSGTGSVS